MNKLKLSFHLTQNIILFSLMASVEFMFTPLPSVANREVRYRNCAELQKHLNDNNPQLTIKRFENIKMVRRVLGYQKYTVFCNGGIVIDRELGTICRGYIGYSSSPIGGGDDHYATWGETNGSPNFNDTGAEKYCRLIK
jgi:hypothetical protein